MSLFGTSSFTRPDNTTAYAQFDLIANHATAGSVVVPYLTCQPYAPLFEIVGVNIRTDTALLTNGAFRVHFFKGTTPPVPTVGDNAAFDSSDTLATTGTSSYIGTLITTAALSRVFSTEGTVHHGLAEETGARLFFTVGANPGKLYWLLEANAAYVPTAEEVFTCDPLLVPYQTNTRISA